MEQKKASLTADPGEPVIKFDHTAYLPGAKAAVTISKSKITDPAKDPVDLSFPDKSISRVVLWGNDNKAPDDIIETCKDSPVVSSGIPFNIYMTYGDGIAYGKYSFNSKGNRIFTPQNDNTEINAFFLDNDINNYLLEQINDITWFYNVFPEIILNKNKKIVELNHKEATFSRWGEMDAKTGLIKHHFYSAHWATEKPTIDQVDVTPVLSPRNTVRDLQIRMGIIPDSKGKKAVPSNYRYIIPINFPTPGKNYYQRPYWYSIIDSGWLDYSKKIPEFKNALLDNQMVIKYHVELSDDYFEKIFSAEGINDDSAKQARVKKEYTDLNKFLSNVKNTGKTVISFIRYDSQGREQRRMKINVIENHFKGGEYIEDSEEASNILSYALGVHPSLIGSSPGKNSNISGTEARELFIIKQALLKPIRDRLLRPLNIIKQFNGWPEDIDFAIPNMVLTTLDKGTGSEKVIS